MKTSAMATATRGLTAAALGLLGAASAAWAQGAMDPKVMQRYAGVLAPECANYLLPQLLYLGDSLVVRNNGKPVLTGRDLRLAPTYFGASPPPEFETAVTSEVSAGEKLVFVFYRTASGLFAVVEGSPKVMAAVPAALKTGRIRHCDPNRNLAPGAKPPEELYPTALLKDPKFKRSYASMLGALSSEPWLMRMDGPAQPVKNVKVAGTDYQFVSVCKNHDCYDNNIVVLYAPATQAAHAKVLRGNRPMLLGAPPAPVAAELESLWKATYRSGK
jgi:hypothetical protein